MSQIEPFLYDWSPVPSVYLQQVKIEDDSLRDGLQAAFIRHPSLEQKQHLLSCSAAVGTQAAMLGFPASSPAELAECQALVRYIEQQALSIVPRFLARPLAQDLQPIVELQQHTSLTVWADFLINPSPLRAHVEGWDFAEILSLNQVAGEFLTRQQTLFGISIEDATRTPPTRLQQAVRSALDCGAKVLTICDTVGAATPAGATRLLNFVKQQIVDIDVEIWWHGHNDRGLSLANALAAAEAGADCISGSFLGIGERTGNTPLEQLLLHLQQAGHSGFNLSKVPEYCEQLAEYTNSPIPDNQPLVGKQVFATGTGTHAAAIAKARTLGAAFEDSIFSAVPASHLGKQQHVLLGPSSGAANARLALQQAGIAVNQANITKALAAAHNANTWLDSTQLKAMFA